MLKFFDTGTYLPNAICCFFVIFQQQKLFFHLLFSFIYIKCCFSKFIHSLPLNSAEGRFFFCLCHLSVMLLLKKQKKNTNNNDLSHTNTITFIWIFCSSSTLQSVVSRKMSKNLCSSVIGPGGASTCGWNPCSMFIVLKKSSRTKRYF